MSLFRQLIDRFRCALSVFIKKKFTYHIIIINFSKKTSYFQLRKTIESLAVFLKIFFNYSFQYLLNVLLRTKTHCFIGRGIESTNCLHRFGIVLNYKSLIIVCNWLTFVGFHFLGSLSKWSCTFSMGLRSDAF